MSAIKNIINAPLKTKLIELIRLRGSMSVSDYMKIVLTNPESGFYMNNDVFGVKGHFTTNPEISQIFGEALGVWILQEWRRFNCPKPLRLVEFGPGRGTLMSDITRTLNAFKQTHNNVHVKMIEVSPHLKKLQQETLKSNYISSIEWHTHINSIDDNSPQESNGFTAYIAHEYLDALPIHKFVVDPKSNKWRELLIDYDQEQNLRFCISREPSLTAKLLVPKDFQGDHLEVCPEAALQLEKVAQKLDATKKGCMLICDYGFEDDLSITEKDVDGFRKVPSSKLVRSSRDTFRAFKNHEPWPPLKDPGEADLTADVDFGYLKKHLQDKALVFGSTSQREFLLKCGIQARLKVLIEKATDGKQREDFISSSKMLIEDMGQRYRFLSLFPKGTESMFERDPPAGFGGH